MKTVKFRPDLVPLVLSGEKTITWRLFDDKDFKAGDDIQLLEFVTLRHFADGRITKVVEKPFKDLSEAEKDGHESYPSDEAMYQTYSTYYKTEVGPDTPVKVMWFELISKK